MSDLSNIPTEIIELVAGNLESEDLLNIRLVCRALYEKTTRCIGQIAFSTLKTDFSSGSFHKLNEISNDERFRHHVRTLLIKEPLDQFCLGRGILWPRSPFASLTGPIPGFELLRKILLDGLRNCRSFCISVEKISRFIRRSDDYLIANDAIAIIFAIIAEIGLPVESFHVLQRPGISADSINLNRLNALQHQMLRHRAKGSIPTSWKQVHLLPEPMLHFRVGWANLEELDWGLSLRSLDIEWTVLLISRASNLKKLSLSPQSHNALAFCSFLKRLCFTDTLPKLQELKLTNAGFTEKAVSQMLLLFRDNLRTLSIAHCHIRPDWGTWPSALREWGSTLGSLQRFSLEAVGTIFEQVIFPSLHDDPIVPDTGNLSFELTYGHDGCQGVNYQGPHMDKALEILARSVVLGDFHPDHR